MIRYIHVRILNLAFALYAMSLAAYAQDDGQQLERIEELIVQREWISAARALTSLKSGCRTKACEGKANFALAYLYHQKLNAVGDPQNLWRDSAQFFYREVLKDYPDNASAYQNLALLYKSSDQAALSVTLLRRAYALNNDDIYLLSIGDQFLQQTSYDSALHYYRRALAHDPLSRPAHERLIHMYAARGMRADQIMPHCRQMAGLGFDELASKALIQVIQREYKRAPKDCERAFLWWTNIAGRSLSIDTRSLLSLPADWNFKGLNELKHVLTSEWKMSDLTWWSNEQPVNIIPGLDLKPNFVIGEVIRSKAQQLRKNNQPAAAVREYENAYKIIVGTQNIHPFLDHADRIPDIFYQVAGELALMYTKYPTLDPDNRKFSRLESELFSGKGMAYMGSDKESIVKFHTTLGLVYAERNQWRGGRFQNAFFQLRNAIQRAPESKNTAYLKVLLSEGHRKNNDNDQARRLLMDAAISYLNDDNFSSVASTLSVYDSIDGARDPKYLSIRQITSFRKELDKLPPQRLVRISEMLDSVDAMLNAGDLSPYFRTIQRFKILSDLGNLAFQYQDKRAAYTYYGSALQQVFSVNALTNLSDVERINKERAALVRVMTFVHLPREAVPMQAGDVDAKLKKWELYADNFKKQTITMSPELLVGAKVATGFSSLSTELVKPPGIRIDNSKVSFENARSPVSLELQTILKDRGVVLE